MLPSLSRTYSKSHDPSVSNPHGASVMLCLLLRVTRWHRGAPRLLPGVGLVIRGRSPVASLSFEVLPLLLVQWPLEAKGPGRIPMKIRGL